VHLVEQHPAERRAEQDLVGRRLAGSPARRLADHRPAERRVEHPVEPRPAAPLAAHRNAEPRLAAHRNAGLPVGHPVEPPVEPHVGHPVEPPVGHRVEQRSAEQDAEPNVGLAVALPAELAAVPNGRSARSWERRLPKGTTRRPGGPTGETVRPQLVWLGWRAS